MNKIYQEYANTMAEDSEIPIYESEIEQAKEDGTIFQDKTILEDEHGNEITIPGGFKIAEDSGDTVQQGIVIEDVSASIDENVQGSQYVWIPVGTFIKDDKTESNEIVLGRYTFNEIDGTPHLEQDAVNYISETTIDSYYIELSTYREGIISSGIDGLNTTAYNLAEFIESVNENGGYYIGRYEASYASGDSITNYRAASKVSENYSSSSMSYMSGTLWNYITQIDASKVAINTYKDSNNVKSDLMNSYAWDTAIVYIQEAGNSNYANKNGYLINNSLINTGTKQDEVCKINDMASNASEWSTEYCNYKNGNTAGSCVTRGGLYGYSDGYTVDRDISDSSYRNYDIGFRINIYI